MSSFDVIDGSVCISIRWPNIRFLETAWFFRYATFHVSRFAFVFVLLLFSLLFLLWLQVHLSVCVLFIIVLHRRFAFVLLAPTFCWFVSDQNTNSAIFSIHLGVANMATGVCHRTVLRLVLLPVYAGCALNVWKLIWFGVSRVPTAPGVPLYVRMHVYMNVCVRVRIIIIALAVAVVLLTWVDLLLPLSGLIGRFFVQLLCFPPFRVFFPH